MATLLYYFAASTDSGCLLGCDHQHETVISAVACCASAGSYVVAVEDGALRELNKQEESEFQFAMYGYDTNEGHFLSTVIAVIAFLSHYAKCHS